MMGDVTPYTGLVTSEHASKPNFMASVTATCQPLADLIAVLNSIPSAYDLDQAAGAQLNTIGRWVGASRYVAQPLTGVYFSLDADGLGFDQGVIWAPGDPTTGLIALPDDIYLMLIKARIASNHWDGTKPGAYAIWNTLLSPYGLRILIQDNGDMTVTLALTGGYNNPTFQALFIGGHLNFRAAGVGVVGYFYPSADAPLFGLDVENDAIAGLDVGCVAVSAV